MEESEDWLSHFGIYHARSRPIARFDVIRTLISQSEGDQNTARSGGIMSVCSHCGHTISPQASFPDQIGVALGEFSASQGKKPATGSPDYDEIFHALLYLGKSRDSNDQLAFHLLHQIFVMLTRHDRDQDLPSLDQMWRNAQQRIRGFCN